MKKSAKLASHVVISNIAIGSLPTLQKTHGLLALFEKIYHGDPIFTVISNNRENVRGASKIKLKNVNKKRMATARRLNFFGISQGIHC
jgi:hypothetical protein